MNEAAKVPIYEGNASDFGEKERFRVSGVGCQARCYNRQLITDN